VTTTAEVVRIVVEVPPASLDVPGVVIEAKPSANLRERIQVAQHLDALGGRRRIGTPQHTAREFVDRVVDPMASATVGGATLFPSAFHN
jgi:hypothetical protein